eukprot:4337802-Pleurochrysis_carterae.AAC.3
MAEPTHRAEMVPSILSEPDQWQGHTGSQALLARALASFESHWKVAKRTADRGPAKATHTEPPVRKKESSFHC